MEKWELVTESLPQKTIHVWVTHIEDGEYKVDETTYLAQIKKFLFYESEDVIAWMPVTKPTPYREQQVVCQTCESRLIDAETLKEEIRNLRVHLTGLRGGKGIISKFEKMYRDSILRIIDEQKRQG